MNRLGVRCLARLAHTMTAGLTLGLLVGCTQSVQSPPSVPAALSGLTARDFVQFAHSDNAKSEVSHGPGRAVNRESHPPPAPLGRQALPLGSEEDYAVRIVAPNTSCSGALISERLVLTAHHCVAERDREGRIKSQDLPPQALSVELGSGHFPWAEVAVSAIIAPSCGYQAGVGDLAILVLARRMRGVQTIQPNLDREPQLGDEVSHFGFGRCALSEDGIYLKRRARGKVDQVNREGFRVTAPLCPGDSGGPVIDHESGALIGVVSAGAMDGDEQTPDRVQFARLDAFRALFANASRSVSGVPLSELPPVDCPTTPTATGERPGKTKSLGSSRPAVRNTPSHADNHSRADHEADHAAPTIHQI